MDVLRMNMQAVAMMEEDGEVKRWKQMILTGIAERRTVSALRRLAQTMVLVVC